MKKQKYLSVGGMIIYLTFIGAFIPLSTDLYLPALPEPGIISRQISQENFGEATS